MTIQKYVCSWHTTSMKIHKTTGAFNAYAAIFWLERQIEAEYNSCKLTLLNTVRVILIDSKCIQAWCVQTFHCFHTFVLHPCICKYIHHKWKLQTFPNALCGVTEVRLSAHFFFCHSFNATIGCLGSQTCTQFSWKILRKMSTFSCFKSLITDEHKLITWAVNGEKKWQINTRTNSNKVFKYLSQQINFTTGTCTKSQNELYKNQRWCIGAGNIVKEQKKMIKTEKAQKIWRGS